MDYFYTKRKLSILKDYEQFLTEELKKPITERAGTLDKEHLVILQEMYSEYENKKPIYRGTVK